MLTILHLFDGFAGWEQRIAAGLLLERLPADRYRQVLATIDPAALPHIAKLRHKVHRATGILGLRPQFLSEHGIDLVHAWGPRAAFAAASAGANTLLELFDPELARLWAQRIRIVAEQHRLSAACSAEWVKRRLLEGGVPTDNCTVIRPGVDFAAINAVKRRNLRGELGVPAECMLVITPEPQPRPTIGSRFRWTSGIDHSPRSSRFGGQSDVFWAVAVLNHLNHRIRIIIPGISTEQARIARYAESLPTENSLICPGDRYEFEELLPHADVLALAPEGDVSTTAIAWAMAAKVAVVAPAIHSVTELVAHKVGGLLFKRSPGRCNPGRIVRLLEDRETQRKTAEAAHGMAYEAFGVRRFVDEHIAAYETSKSRNGAEPRLPGRGVDSRLRA